VVSDWGSIGEMIAHGYTLDTLDAAVKAITAGSDVDMESRAYITHLPALVREGKVPEKLLDDAVRRILTKKFEMGLFENPFKYCNVAGENKQWNNKAHLAETRNMAAKSIVLLKNDSLAGTQKAVLPLKATGQKIALIGPLVKAKSENLGFWSFDWPDDSTRIVSLWEGVKAAVKDTAQLLYAKGCNHNDTDTLGFAEAVRIAMQADIIVLSVGELRGMSGEAKSRSVLNLPGMQEQLIKRLAATGKPLVVMISAGRPLIVGDIAAQSHALVYSWWLGTEAGNAMADVLFGKYNPSGRLPVTFPRTEGQIPIYYNYLNTGRPSLSEADRSYTSGYMDLPKSPQYAFGYGLGYGAVTYSKPVVSSLTPKGNETIEVKVSVAYDGISPRTETVQLYIRDKTASVSRPVMELRKFKQITLLPDEQKVVTFKITTEDLKFYNNDLQHVWEPGLFDIMVGSASDKVQAVTVNWKN
jgi:beta-glucosidase